MPLQSNIDLIKKLGGKFIEGSVSDAELKSLAGNGVAVFAAQEGYTRNEVLFDFASELLPQIEPEVLHQINSRMLAVSIAACVGSTTYMRNSDLEKHMLAYELVKYPDRAQAHFADGTALSNLFSDVGLRQLKQVILSPVIQRYDKVRSYQSESEMITQHRADSIMQEAARMEASTAEQAVSRPGASCTSAEPMLPETSEATAPQAKVGNLMAKQMADLQARVAEAEARRQELETEAARPYTLEKLQEYLSASYEEVIPNSTMTRIMEAWHKRSHCRRDDTSGEGMRNTRHGYKAADAAMQELSQTKNLDDFLIQLGKLCNPNLSDNIGRGPKKQFLQSLLDKINEHLTSPLTAEEKPQDLSLYAFMIHGKLGAEVELYGPKTSEEASATMGNSTF